MRGELKIEDDETPDGPAVWWKTANGNIEGTERDLDKFSTNASIAMYSRVSTGEQGVKGLGVSSQRRKILETVLSRAGNEYVLVVADLSEARSADSGSQALLLDMIADVSRFKPKPVLWAYTSDRLARNDKQRVRLQDQLDKYKMKLEYADGFPEDYRPMQQAMGTMERKFIRDRIVRAMKERKARGQISHAEVEMPMYDGKATYRSVAKRQRKAALIRRKFRPYVEPLRAKGHSIREITQRLAKDFTDAPTRSQVARIVTDPNDDLPPTGEAADEYFAEEIRRTNKVMRKSKKRVKQQRLIRLGAFLENNGPDAIMTKGADAMEPKYTAKDVPEEMAARARAEYKNAMDVS
jgi:DNA invertase Pin-like site-specific DNA recombinase